MRKHMKLHDIFNAKSSELRASLAAIRRAAALARKTAIDTNTHLVVVVDGALVRIPAEQLRREADSRAVA